MSFTEQLFLLSVICPFAGRLLNSLNIGMLPKAESDFFLNIIKKFKDQHKAGESVSICLFLEKKKDTEKKDWSAIPNSNKDFF